MLHLEDADSMMEHLNVLVNECMADFPDDDKSAVAVMRLHIAYAHNDTCATLLRRFGTIRTQGRQRTTKRQHFTTICDVLHIPFYNTLQCSLSLFQPFLTFSDAFRPFATFLNFALFNTPPNCVAFSGTFHQTLFT